MKKRFLALALVAIPLLTSCGKFKETDWTTWKATYDAAQLARTEVNYTEMRLKGVCNGVKFDSEYTSVDSPRFEPGSGANTSWGWISSSSGTIGNVIGYQGQGYTLLVKGKNYGFIYITTEYHYNEYGRLSYYGAASDSLNISCNILYK